MSEDDLNVGFCARCGEQLDDATPAASMICWQCEDEDEDNL